VVTAAGRRIGGGGLTIVAGPCAVENEQQVLRAAREVAAAGADFLRGGAYKPRTSPYEFQGLGERGLELLARAREAT
jgi:3-deoxy-7-phosphoheptulonate synthase